MCDRIEPSTIICYGKKPEFKLKYEDRIVWFDISQ